MEKIRYHKDITVDEDGIYLINDFRYIDLPTEHTRFYAKYKELIKSLNGTEKNILFFLLEKMDDNNIVGTDVYTLDSYNKEYCTTLTASSFNSSISKMRKLKILLSKSRGYSYINPIYFFKGYSKDRIKLVQYLLSDTKEFKAPFNQQDLFI